jgi:formylglycine-generating enzyme required for sulfatase activity
VQALAAAIRADDGRSGVASGSAEVAVAAVPATEAARLLPETQGPAPITHHPIGEGSWSGVGPEKKAPHRRWRPFGLAVLAASCAVLTEKKAPHRRWRPFGLAVLAASCAVLIAAIVLLTRPGSPVPAPRKPRTNTIGMELVLIPAGEFLMGSPDDNQNAGDDEKQQHRVRITRPFYLGVHEVTQGQYREVTGANPSDFQGSDDLPVEHVSWDEAIAFCNKLSEHEGLKPYYRVGGGAPLGGDGYRLPTEAEWEYACRAGSTTRFSFGDDEARLGEYAWFVGNSDSKTHPVGQKRPNAFGLYDMHGNVWEWCWDGYEAKSYAGSPGADPLGPSQAAARVIRGGGWIIEPRLARSTYRYGFSPEYRKFDLGFRVARSPAQSLSPVK